MPKYIITDPRYILSNEVWSDIWNQCAGLPDKEYSKKFRSLISKALNTLAGTKNAVACKTGFGDWDNQIYGCEDKIIERFFTADSGMVCVVKYNKAIKNALIARGNGKFISEGRIALLKTEGKVNVEMDTDDEEWTVVYINDEVDYFNSSLPPEEKDYDDYDEDDEEEDED